MLALVAFAMVGTFMALIMTRRLAPMVALILVPLAFALALGTGTAVGPMMLDGVKALAPTGVLLVFAILYFATMSDAGLFDPLVDAILRATRDDPARVVLGTAALALVVSLDGDGSTTYMITVAALLPVYRRLRLDPLLLTVLPMMALGVTNITPWGGPTTRAASALQLDPGTLFVPMVGPMLVAAGWVLALAWRLGLRERARLARLPASDMVRDATPPDDGLAAGTAATRRPRLRPANAALTAMLLVALVAGVMPLPVLFMIAFAIALLLNYPSPAEQKARIAAHAPNVLAVSGLIFAAGAFTGILAGTRMVDAMAEAVVQAIPPALGPHLAIVTAVVSIPFTFFISNDAFYFGVLPILAKAGAVYGLSAAEIGRASLVGQPVHLLSPLVPSTYLLVGLVGVELGEHQKRALGWSLVTALVLLVAAIVVGVIPAAGRVAG